MNINYVDTENGVAGFSQKNYRLKRHAHFPIEVVFALSGEVAINTDTHQYSHIQSAIINAKVPHTFDCAHGVCQLYFIDPTSYAGRKIKSDHFSSYDEIVLLDGIDATQFREIYLSADDAQHAQFAPIDERVERCLDWIKQNFSLEKLNISMLAGIAFLSESRLAHLFAQEVGISIHQYILWKKVEMAVKRAMEGFPLTDCAYASGFADSSHFIKTFQKMFGIYPSFAVKK